MKRFDSSDRSSEASGGLGEVLRTGLEAPPEVHQRVKHGALEARSGGRASAPGPRGTGLRWVVASFAVAAALVIVILAPWRAVQNDPALVEGAPAAGPSSYSVSNEDGVLVVRRSDQVIAMIERRGG